MAAISCALLTHFGMDQNTFSLTFFNLLFISTIFPLEGKLSKKLFMLVIGNLLCLIWNTLYYNLADINAVFSNKFFDLLFTILGPYLNIIWIVSFWSISLTVLRDSQKSRERIGFDD